MTFSRERKRSQPPTHKTDQHAKGNDVHEGRKDLPRTMTVHTLSHRFGTPPVRVARLTARANPEGLTPRFALTDQRAVHCDLSEGMQHTVRYNRRPQNLQKLTLKTLTASTPLTNLLRRTGREAGTPTSPQYETLKSESRQPEAIHFRRIRCSYRIQSQTTACN